MRQLLHKVRVRSENECLLGVFRRHEVLMANGQRELVLGLEISESGGIGVCRSASFGIETVFEYVGDLANGVMSVGIRVGWIEVDPDLVAG